MPRLLIAGSTGFLGQKLVCQAADAGHEVVALARPTSVAKLDDVHDRITEVRTAQLDDPPSLKEAMTGVEAVVTTVGMTRPEKGMDPLKVDYRGNLNLLEAATAAGVGHFTYVSLDGVELPGADRISVIAAKKQFEEALRESDLDWAIARPNGFFWNYGIYLTLARQHGVMRLIGDGEAKTTPIDDDELAKAIVDRVGLADQTYSVGGPQDLSFNEVGELIGRTLDRPVKVRHYPLGMTNAALKLISPLASSRAALLEMFVWLMNANVTSDHVGERTLEDWLVNHRDETFTI